MFVVELLTVRVWLLSVWPRLLRRRVAGQPVRDTFGVATAVTRCFQKWSAPSFADPR